jgi:hypothetical protein
MRAIHWSICDLIFDAVLVEVRLRRWIVNRDIDIDIEFVNVIGFHWGRSYLVEIIFTGDRNVAPKRSSFGIPI